MNWRTSKEYYQQLAEILTAIDTYYIPIKGLFVNLGFAFLLSGSAVLKISTTDIALIDIFSLRVQ